MAEPKTPPVAPAPPPIPQRQSQAFVPPPPRLKPDGLEKTEQVTSRWTMTMPGQYSLKQVTDRDFWRHVAYQLRPGDFIDVHAEDGSYYAELYVRSAHKTGAIVAVLREHALVGEVDTSALNGTTLTVKHISPNKKYGILAGEQIVKDGFQTAEDAYRYLADNRQNVAA